jgi:hypothetical protein
MRTTWKLRAGREGGPTAWKTGIVAEPVQEAVVQDRTSPPAEAMGTAGAATCTQAVRVQRGDARGWRWRRQHDSAETKATAAAEVAAV